MCESGLQFNQAPRLADATGGAKTKGTPSRPHIGGDCAARVGSRKPALQVEGQGLGEVELIAHNHVVWDTDIGAAKNVLAVDNHVISGDLALKAAADGSLR